MKAIAALALVLSVACAAAYVFPDPPAIPASDVLRSAAVDAVDLPVNAGAALRSRVTSEAISCALCMDLAAALGPALRANLTMDVILEIGIPICTLVEKSHGWPDCKESTCEELCRGLITEESVDLFSVLLDSVLAPAELCYLVSVCPAPPAPPTPSGYIPVRSNLSDHTGERHDFPIWNASSSATGTFVHITDIHVDLLYTAGTNSTCDMPICCRTEFGPGNSTHSAGAWGDFNCDPPVQLVESLFKRIAAMDPAPDFILYTGDDPAHDIWEQSRAANLKNINTISALFLQYFPHIPVYSAIGNHEAYPVNEFEGPPGDLWLTKSVAAAWSYYLTPDAQRTLAYGGYFQQRIRPGLRVVSLNTNLYMSGNFWLIANHTDYTCQLNWLEDVLEQATALDEKVIVIAHATCSAWDTDFCERYGGLVTKFRKTIIGMFNGHTHTAEIQLFYDNSTGTPEPSHVVYMPGSVTMVNGVNPTMRVMSWPRALPLPYIATSFAQYWTDVPTTNADGEPDWTTLRYTAPAEYSMPDLSPQSWLTVANAVLSNTTMYDLYLNAYSRDAPLQGSPPSPRVLYCVMVSENDAQYRACLKAAGETAPQRIDC